jgi:hypothetical protein
MIIIKILFIMLLIIFIMSAITNPKKFVEW